MSIVIPRVCQYFRNFIYTPYKLKGSSIVNKKNIYIIFII